ncbi:hypothetical protein PHLGIDRAFT_317209 [Phlebiopsis gigantea 11061_1 CR5-6]|uniref:Uncharacterized protein n=1 Tax=Phlebiopsis gigantea (strain 11061_1 CR5-6) TaxID=745531 RepID=A0A0C3PQT1_PHLG1|nr:hypothetical protein PHLGIDRAFT_317209 [Phlebiopsis gigantea 11061_1 CR5-6]
MPRQTSRSGASEIPTLADDSRSKHPSQNEPGRVDGQTAASLIPRPKEQPRAVFTRASGGQSLQHQMHLPLDAMKQLTCKLRFYIQKYLNKKRSFARQDKKAFGEYMRECHKIAKLQNYVGCWPAESYCRLYLTLSSARKPSGSDRQQPVVQTRGARETDMPRTMRSVPEPNEVDEDPEIVGVKAEVPHVCDDSVRAERGIPNKSSNPKPLQQGHSDQPCTNRSCSLMSEKIKQLDISEFVATIEPSQPGLDTVLLHAGVQRWQCLLRLAGDIRLQDRFFDMLVREDKISRFQSVLLGDALRRLFTPK